MYLNEEHDRSPAIESKPEIKAGKLADNLSGLLRQAVEDSMIVETMPGYGLKMSSWHIPARVLGQSCLVCMAGALMVRRLGTSQAEWCCPESFDHTVCGKLVAVDHMRSGGILSAADAMNIKIDNELRSKVQIIGLAVATERMKGPLASQGRAEWSTYLHAADELEAIGL